MCKIGSNFLGIFQFSNLFSALTRLYWADLIQRKTKALSGKGNCRETPITGVPKQGAWERGKRPSSATDWVCITDAPRPSAATPGQTAFLLRFW